MYQGGAARQRLKPCCRLHLRCVLGQTTAGCDRQALDSCRDLRYEIGRKFLVQLVCQIYIRIDGRSSHRLPENYFVAAAPPRSQAGP